METTDITNHAELSMQIMHLKALRSSQEEELKLKFKEFVYTLNPAEMVKESLHNLAEDKQVKFDLAKVGLNLGANFILDRILGRHSGIKGFVSALLIENISPSFISSKVSNIYSGIGRLFHRKPRVAIGSGPLPL